MGNYSRDTCWEEGRNAYWKLAKAKDKLVEEIETRYYDADTFLSISDKGFKVKMRAEKMLRSKFKNPYEHHTLSYQRWHDGFRDAHADYVANPF